MNGNRTLLARRSPESAPLREPDAADLARVEGGITDRLCSMPVRNTGGIDPMFAVGPAMAGPLGSSDVSNGF